MTYEELNAECSQMQYFLEQPTGDDPTVMIEKLEQLNTYLARSGYLLAEAERMRDERVDVILEEYVKRGYGDLSKMPPTVLKSIVSAKTSKETYYATWLDRINRSAVHIGDNLRTQISYSKEEMRLTKNGY